MQRRQMAILVAAVFVVATVLGLSPRPASAATPFTDIATSTFKSDIDWMYNEGVTAGCAPTLFCPTDEVTRGQMASFLVRMFDLPSTSTDYFSDDDGTTHEANINRLRAAGITTGCAVGAYCPNDTVTRGQMASFIVRAADFTVGAGRDYFYDDNGTTHEANIDRSAAAGVASGCATWRYCPAGPVTREQMAGFLHRVVKPITPPSFPAPPPPPPLFTFGSGTKVVGDAVPPGRYRSPGSASCYWERLSGFGGTFGEIIANGFGSVKVVVEIKSTDAGFDSSSCGTWTNSQAPITSSKTSPFAQGTYIVGVDIAAGTWSAPGGSSCYWERVSGFGGEIADIIANDFGATSPIVSIAADDAGFSSSQCGTWTRIS